jgi:plastocyanin
VKRALLLVVVIVLVASGCGDDDGSSASGGASASGSGSASAAEADAPVKLSGKVNNHGDIDVTNDGDTAEVVMELDDFYLGPTFVKGAPGQTVTVELENEGEADHTFTIDSLSIDETLSPGDTKEVDVKLPESGVLAYYCRFHKVQGMQGAFYLQAGTTSSSPSSTVPSLGGY